MTSSSTTRSPDQRYGCEPDTPARDLCVRPGVPHGYSLRRRIVCGVTAAAGWRRAWCWRQHRRAWPGRFPAHAQVRRLAPGGALGPVQPTPALRNGTHRRLALQLWARMAVVDESHGGRGEAASRGSQQRTPNGVESPTKWKSTRWCLIFSIRRESMKRLIAFVAVALTALVGVTSASRQRLVRIRGCDRESRCTCVATSPRSRSGIPATSATTSGSPPSKCVGHDRPSRRRGGLRVWRSRNRVVAEPSRHFHL